MLRTDSAFDVKVSEYVSSQAGMKASFVQSGKNGSDFLLENILGFRLEYIAETVDDFRNVYTWRLKPVGAKWWVLNIFNNLDADLCGAIRVSSGGISAWFDLKNSPKSNSWWNSVMDVEGMGLMFDRLDAEDKVFLSLNGVLSGVHSVAVDG